MTNENKIELIESHFEESFIEALVRRNGYLIQHFINVGEFQKWIEANNHNKAVIEWQIPDQSDVKQMDWVVSYSQLMSEKSVREGLLLMYIIELSIT
jgi:hypothetical protein